MNKLFSGISLIAIAFLLVTGCETDNKTLLTDGIWKFSDMTTDSENQTIIELISNAKLYLTDGTLEFKTDGTYIMTSPLLEDTGSGTWSLIGDDTLVMSNDDEPGSTTNIEVLTKKELKYINAVPNTEINGFNSITTIWSR
ncbi:MAG: lipocalin family protein [Bacteroides sp.]|nr:lipocalin family protein [Bacteroides sp.]